MWPSHHPLKKKKNGGGHHPVPLFPKQCLHLGFLLVFLLVCQGMALPPAVAERFSRPGSYGFLWVGRPQRWGRFAENAPGAPFPHDPGPAVPQARNQPGFLWLLHWVPTVFALGSYGFSLWVPMVFALGSYEFLLWVPLACFTCFLCLLALIACVALLLLLAGFDCLLCFLALVACFGCLLGWLALLACFACLL